MVVVAAVGMVAQLQLDVGVLAKKDQRKHPGVDTGWILVI